MIQREQQCALLLKKRFSSKVSSIEKEKIIIGKLNLILNAENVLLSWQRNGLISTIAGIGIISFRASENKNIKPISGITLCGLGGLFFFSGTVGYIRTMNRVLEKNSGFGSTKFINVLAKAGLPLCLYSVGILGLFDDRVRKVLDPNVPEIMGQGVQK